MSEDFRTNFIFVRNQDRLYDRAEGQFVPIEAVLRMHRDEFPRSIKPMDYLLTGQGAVTKVVMAAFEPGQPEIFREGNSLKLNLWKETCLIPREGDVTTFLDHVKMIFNGDEVIIRSFLNFLAHLVQRPADRIMWAIVITGRPGTGKSILAKIAKNLLHERHSTSITPGDLSSSFNRFLDQQLLVVVEEATRDVRRSTSAKLKTWITEEWTLVNPKGENQYKLKNYSRLVFISNEADPVFLDENDRRFLVCVSDANPRDAQYYADLNSWLKHGGMEHILHFLQQVDLSSFDPFSPPPRTAGWHDLVRASQHEAIPILTAALSGADAPFDGDLVVLEDVITHLQHEEQVHLPKRTLVSFLRAAGAREIGRKRLGDGRKVRVWAIRNVDAWANADEATIRRAFSVSRRINL